VTDTAVAAPPIQTVRLSDEPLRAGVERHVKHGVELRVVSAAKTVADCFKFRGRIGTDVAVAALREGGGRSGSRPTSCGGLPASVASRR